MKGLGPLVRAGAVAAVLLVGAIAVPVLANPGGAGSSRFQLVETDIATIQKAVQTGLVSTEQLVGMYLARVAAYDMAGPQLNSYLHVNENAIAAARAEDAARHHGIARLPLDGVPILLKDNIDTFDMPTTAGSNALHGSVPPDDAFIAARLRAAGAIIMGKGSLTEYANFLTNGMPAGYDSELRFLLGGGPLVGYGFNPFDPRPDPRPGFNDGRPVMSPSGSSSGPGISVSANLVTVAIGTEHRARSSTPALRICSSASSRPWRREPRRYHPDHGRSGHGRAARADCRGRGAGARRHCRVRPRGSGNVRVPHAGTLLQRLHAVPQQARAPRSADRGAVLFVLDQHSGRFEPDAHAGRRDEQRDRRAPR